MNHNNLKKWYFSFANLMPRWRGQICFVGCLKSDLVRMKSNFLLLSLDPSPLNMFVNTIKLKSAFACSKLERSTSWAITYVVLFKIWQQQQQTHLIILKEHFCVRNDMWPMTVQWNVANYTIHKYICVVHNTIHSS